MDKGQPERRGSLGWPGRGGGDVSAGLKLIGPSRQEERGDSFCTGSESRQGVFFVGEPPGSQFHQSVQGPQRCGGAE